MLSSYTTEYLSHSSYGVWGSVVHFVHLWEHCRCMHSPNTMCEKYCRAYAVIMTSMHSSITVLLTLILADGRIIVIRASALKGKLH